MQKTAPNEGNSLEYANVKKISTGSISGVLSALQFQHRLFLRETGPLLPARIPPNSVEIILDVICSSGTWCMNFNKQYSAKQIYGVDMHERIIHIARENATLLQTKNLQFQVAQHIPLTLFKELHPLLEEMQRELQQVGFCSVGMLISSVGQKPLEDKN